jgi:hypothetical protein
VEIDFHFVRDMVAKKLLSIKFISSTDQLAWIFTKPLLSSWFGIFCDKLNVISILLSLRGRARDISKPIHPTNNKIKINSNIEEIKSDKDKAQINSSDR